MVLSFPFSVTFYTFEDPSSKELFFSNMNILSLSVKIHTVFQGQVALKRSKSKIIWKSLVLKCWSSYILSFLLRIYEL